MGRTAVGTLPFCKTIPEKEMAPGEHRRHLFFGKRAHPGRAGRTAVGIPKGGMSAQDEELQEEAGTARTPAPLSFSGVHAISEGPAKKQGRVQELKNGWAWRQRTGCILVRVRSHSRGENARIMEMGGRANGGRCAAIRAELIPKKGRGTCTSGEEAPEKRQRRAHIRSRTG